MTLDGLTGVSQDHMRAYYQTGSNHMMLNVNLWSTLVLGAGKNIILIQKNNNIADLNSVILQEKKWEAMHMLLSFCMSLCVRTHIRNPIKYNTLETCGNSCVVKLGASVA